MAPMALERRPFVEARLSVFPGSLEGLFEFIEFGLPSIEGNQITPVTSREVLPNDGKELGKLLLHHVAHVIVRAGSNEPGKGVGGSWECIGMSLKGDKKLARRSLPGGHGVHEGL